MLIRNTANGAEEMQQSRNGLFEHDRGDVISRPLEPIASQISHGRKHRGYTLACFGAAELSEARRVMYRVQSNQRFPNRESAHQTHLVESMKQNVAAVEEDGSA